MANQISKQAILEFLKERLDRAKHSSKFKNQYTEFNEGKAWILENLVSHIERGLFDETEYITYPNGAMIDKKITSDLDISK
jgi:hypothetical protein